MRLVVARREVLRPGGDCEPNAMTTPEEMLARGIVRAWPGVATVDPGIGGTGLAIWASLQQNSPAAQPPNWHDVLRPRGTWEQRTDAVCDWLKVSISGLGLQHILIEKPQVWPDSAKSAAAAASGNLLKLVMLVGGMRQTIRSVSLDIEIILVPPGRRKGQLSKPALRKRVVKALGEPYREHERDAVGMGLAVQGWIDRRKG